jgi:hypothetical protein
MGVRVNLLSGFVVAQKWVWLQPAVFAEGVLVAVPSTGLLRRERSSTTRARDMALLALTGYLEVTVWGSVTEWPRAVMILKETYDDAEHNQYIAECSIWDEGDQFFTETFDNWRQERLAQGICPYNNASGEVDFYRLELTLNDLGRAFLVVDEFATTGERQLTKGGAPSGNK